jgi:hypothetical protein
MYVYDKQLVRKCRRRGTDERMDRRRIPACRKRGRCFAFEDGTVVGPNVVSLMLSSAHALGKRSVLRDG